MKAPISWMLSYTDIDDVKTKKQIHDFASEMTLSGSKVESVDTMGEGIDKVVVAKCMSLQAHANSDHLKVCMMDVGANDLLQIVTGAPNVRLGAYIPVALDGASIAGGKSIKKGKLRGVDSFGMMCSFEEIGLDYRDYKGGIEDGVMILEDLEMFAGYGDMDKLIGHDIMEVLGACETVIDFEITSNRPDCLSVLGLAREAAATKKKHFCVPDVSVKEESDKNIEDILSVEIKAFELCPRYMARVVTDVNIAPSPKWMRERLNSCGVRAINNIVDITNYVMLEYGQPMHAFDRKAIRGNKITVRRALCDETMKTLDGQDRKLNSNMLVISDDEGAIAAAGIMGGENSEISEDTMSIVFESAIFEPVTVRKGAKSVGLRTESSSRFEKGLDVVTCERALERAAQLVEMLGAGKICKGKIDCYPSPKQDRQVPYDVEYINKFIGIHASKQEMDEILTAIEFRIEDGYVIPPSFRDDIICKADVAEEIARFYGYNKIESSLLKGCETTLGKRDMQQLTKNYIRKAMTGLGYNEMLTFSFESPSVFEKIKAPADSKLRDCIVITNPLGEDYSIMRTSMLPSLLETVSLNNSHRVDKVKVFELSYVYLKTEKYPEELPEHKELLSFGGYGFAEGSDAFFKLKGDTESMLDALKISDYRFEAYKEGGETYHPGRTAKLYIGGKEAGILGQIHPSCASSYECPYGTYVAFIDAKAIYENSCSIVKVKDLPKFPAVTRDLAVVVDDAVTAGQIESTIRERGGKCLEECKFFDCYKGASLPEGKKSMAYSLSFRDNTKTLTDEDVSKFMKKILNGLEFKFGATLR